MDDDDKKTPIGRQPSLSCIEQSLKISPAPPQEPVTIYRAPIAANANLSKVDIDIMTRLEKLRQSRKTDLPSEDEVAIRLANLKGLPSDHYATKKQFQKPDLRTQVEKSDDLFNQVLEEVSLDKRMAQKDADEIESRLTHLRESAVTTDSGKDSITSKIPQTSDEVISSSSVGMASRVMIDSNEVEQLMRETEKEMAEAAKSVKSLHEDPQLHEALKHGKSHHLSSSGRRSSTTSSEEKFSSDDNEEVEEGATGGHPSKQRNLKEEEQEVERIVQLYTKKAEEKKKRKLEKKKKRKGVEGVVDSDEGSSEDESMSTSSDLSISSDKLSSLSDQ